MNGRVSRVLLLALLLATPVLARPRAQTEPRVELLEARRDGERIVVSYRLVDLLPDEVMERIHSGIRLRFRHKIEIVEKRPGLFAGDRTHARATLETSVAYDSLTERYELARSLQVRGRPKDESAEPLEQQALVDSEQEMRRWLTEVQDVSLFGPPQGIAGDPALEVRVEVVLGRRWILLVIPTTETITAERELGADG